MGLTNFLNSIQGFTATYAQRTKHYHRTTAMNNILVDYRNTNRSVLNMPHQNTRLL